MKKKNNSQIWKTVVITLAGVFCILTFHFITNSTYNENHYYINKPKEKYYDFDEQKVNLKLIDSEKENRFSIKYGFNVKDNSIYNKLPSEVTMEEINSSVHFSIPINIELKNLKPFDESGQLNLIYELDGKEINLQINGFKKSKNELKNISQMVNSTFIEVKNQNESINFNGYFIDYEINGENYPLKWFLIIPDDKLNYIDETSEFYLLKRNEKILVNNIKKILSGVDVLDDYYVNLAVIEINFNDEQEAKRFTNNNFNLIENNTTPFFSQLNSEFVSSYSYYSKNDNKSFIYTDRRDMDIHLWNFSGSEILNKYPNEYKWMVKILIRNSYFNTEVSSGSPLLKDGYLFLYDNLNLVRNDLSENNVGLYTPISTVFDNNWSHIKKYCYDFIYGSGNSLQKNWYLSSLVNKYPKIQTKLLNDFRFNNKKWFVGDTNAQLK